MFGVYLSLILYCQLLNQGFHVLLRLHAELFLETGGEVTGIAEAHLVCEVADTESGISLRKAPGLLQTDVADETGDVQACDGAQFVVYGRRAGTHVSSEGFAVVGVVVKMSIDTSYGTAEELLIRRLGGGNNTMCLVGSPGCVCGSQ